LRFSVLLLFAARAFAFEDATQFFAGVPHAATYGASSEGVYFTGAPRFTSLQCAACHTDGPGQVRLKLGADDPSVFDAGWLPGVTYLFEVELSGETRGLEYASVGCTEPPGPRDTYPYQQCNSNSFALEIDASDGPLAGQGVFCAGPPVAGMCPAASATADEVIVSPDSDAVFGLRQHAASQPQVVLRNDPTSWHFWWTAPPAGTGTLTVYVAAVDGNGGDGTVTNDQDPFGDDTVQASFTLREAGAPPPRTTSAGCEIGTCPSGVTPLLLTLGLCWLRRPGRPRARKNA
jgi:hypothetical protein